MRLKCWCVAAALMGPAFGLSQTPPRSKPVEAPKGKVVQDIWETALINGHRVGYTRVLVEEHTTPSGRKVLRASRDLRLTVRRGPDIARIEAITGTDETPEGTVLGVFMNHRLATQVVYELTGKVEGNQLHVKAVGQSNFDKMVPWNPKAIGTLGELKLLSIKKPKPGDKFDYVIYEPIVNAIVTIRVTAENIEWVSTGREQKQLLKLSAVPDAIGGVQLPLQILWADPNTFEVVRSSTKMPGFGYLVVNRSSKEEALKPLDPNQLPDIMEQQAIKIAQRIVRPHERNRITYRINMADEKEPWNAFPSDGRQSVQNIDEKTKSFDLVVSAMRAPPAVAPVGAVDPGAEFTKSNFFVTSDDPLVKKHAAIATNGRTDPWDKAQAIERWVKDNMRVQNFSEAMAPASVVAKTMTGDCTEYSMLTAAMCRAVGVPSRTAIGLVYVEGPEPMLGFHMWTEVFVRGQWVAIDATLGQGSVGPAHIKITDASWHNCENMTPLLPLMRVMIGRPTVSIVQVK